MRGPLGFVIVAVLAASWTTAPTALALGLSSLAPVPVGTPTAAPAPARHVKVRLKPAPTQLLKGIFARETLACHLGRRSIALVLAGLTRTASDEEKDQGSPFLFLRKGRRPPVLAAGGKQLALKPLRKSGSNPYCPGTLAFNAGHGVLGIVFQVDDRPMPEQLGVVFVDVRRGRVVDGADRLGAFTGLRIEKNALEFRAMISRTESASGVETNIKGRVVVMEEDELRPWYRVALADKGPKSRLSGHLLREANREATWKDSRWKPFFKTREEFEKAFGYESEHSLYSKPWVYVAHVKEQPDEQCILPSSERLPHLKTDSSWFCGNTP